MLTLIALNVLVWIALWITWSRFRADVAELRFEIEELRRACLNPAAGSRQV